VLVFGDADQTSAARVLFDRLGAQRAAQIARARLNGMGVATAPVQTGPRRSTREDPHGLTLREREVFKLVADGLSNEAIARRLHRSERTVEHHVSAVLGKLGVKSRTELIALLAREALAQN
jgi:DNA-binding NarL/FixJ family response regulator